MPPPGENPEQDPVGSYRILLGTRNFSGSFQDSSYRIHTQDPKILLQDTLLRILTFSYRIHTQDPHVFLQDTYSGS